MWINGDPGDRLAPHEFQEHAMREIRSPARSLLASLALVMACGEASPTSPLAVVSSNASSTSAPVAWTSTTLPLLSGYPEDDFEIYWSPVAMNNLGEVIGSPGCIFEPFWYTGCYFTMLYSDGATHAGPYGMYTDSFWGTDINDAGQVVGMLFFGWSNGAMWDHATMVTLGGFCNPVPTAAIYRPYAINNVAQVIGEDCSGNRWFVWQAGMSTELGFRPAALNDRGRIVGARNGRALLWKDGVLTDMGAGEALDINNSNQVLARIDGRFVIWEYGTTRELPSAFEPHLITDNGHIFGSRFGRATLWDRGALIDMAIPGTVVDVNNQLQVLVSGYERRLWNPSY